MARTGQTIAPPNDRRARDALVVVGIGVILLFALIGVVSAGIFIGSKLTGSSKSAAPPRPTATTGNPASIQDLNRAHAQATQIVRVAHATGQSIIKRDTSSAHRQAAAIISAAKKKAATTTAAAGGRSGGLPLSTAGSTTGTTSTPAYSPPPTYNLSPSGTQSSSSTPNLNGLPASWLVVGYNATFGRGPGSAGSITVVNRSRKPLSGVARVVYASGGSASAAFGKLAPGQTEVLALNGPAYRGGGYHIAVDVP